MANSYLDKIRNLGNKPVIPQKPEEEKFEDTIAFPDADATEEEVAEYLKGDEQ